MSALAGGIADPDQYNKDTRKLVAWGKRETTTSGSTGSLVSVLRLDGVLVKSGRAYKIYCTNLAMDSSVANDICQVEIRYTTDGTTATTSSTMMPGVWIREATVNVTLGPIHPLMGTYHPAADQTLSLLLCFSRAAGTGTVVLPGDPTYPLTLYVEDMGPDTGNIGVVL